VDTPLLESLERTREVIIAGNNGASERVLPMLCGLRRDLIAPLIVHGD
jgi:hypothetical protein